MGLSLFGRRHEPPPALVRVVFEMEEPDSNAPSFVDVERVDGLIPLTRAKVGVACRACCTLRERFFSFTLQKLEDARACECGCAETMLMLDPYHGDVGWATNFFENVGYDGIEDEIDVRPERIKGLVVTGRMWGHRDYFGEYDEGFRVEQVEGIALWPEAVTREFHG